MGPCSKRKNKDLYEIYKLLFNAFGPQGWWPARTRFEIIVGAILTQNTAWPNVEKAIKNLQKAGLLDLHALYRTSSYNLYPLLRPSGYYRIKAKRLKCLVKFLQDKYSGNLNELFREPLEKLRRELLEVNGIGQETADSILLYAGKKPIFVVDAYTRRILGHIGILRHRERYEDIQKLFMENIPKDIKIYNEYHALIVRLGKDICRKKPLCGVCPLNSYG